MPHRWCNAKGSCIVVFKFDEHVSFNNCKTKDGGHHSGIPIGCMSGMTLISFRSGFRDVAIPNRT